jgi:hypothetical protein
VMDPWRYEVEKNMEEKVEEKEVRYPRTEV